MLFLIGKVGKISSFRLTIPIKMSIYPQKFTQIFLYFSQSSGLLSLEIIKIIKNAKKRTDLKIGPKIQSNALEVECKMIPQLEIKYY